jgi:hypothetical protein
MDSILPNDALADAVCYTLVLGFVFWLLEG